MFWSDVPYLAPECGDHKIVWELNRHQHWIALGRAFWLTGDARYRERFVAELAGWIDRNPPLMGINWASMLELAFRSLSWRWAIHFFADDRPHEEARSPWLVDLLLALDRQLTHVERNLSYYFSPNTHLLGEALALYVAGARCRSWRQPETRDHRPRHPARGDRPADRRRWRPLRAPTHYHRYTLDFYALALTVARITGDDAAPLVSSGRSPRSDRRHGCSPPTRPPAAHRRRRRRRAVADDRPRCGRSPTAWRSFVLAGRPDSVGARRKKRSGCSGPPSSSPSTVLSLRCRGRFSTRGISCRRPGITS